MTSQWNRRDVLRGLTAISAAALVPLKQAIAIDGGHAVEIQITPVSSHTLRLSLLSANGAASKTIPSNGSLVKESWGTPVHPSSQDASRELSVGNFRLNISQNPLNITVADEHGDQIQQFEWNADAGVLTFLTGDTPLLGLGEGGPQFDRRGSTESMRSGQGAYKLATHGGRVPIPWIMSTSGWAI